MPAPISLGNSNSTPTPGPAPVFLAPSGLTIGNDANADPVQFALHPSRFADPTCLIQKIGPIDLSDNAGVA
jgi:hypothetical protein